MIICFILTPFSTLPSQPLPLLSYRTLMSVCCVWRFGRSFTYVISVCLINDYSLIADLHIFVYGRAECTSISLECTKVKLLILNNFGHEDSEILPIKDSLYFIQNYNRYRGLKYSACTTSIALSEPTNCPTYWMCCGKM